MLLNSICAFVFVAEFQAKYDQQDLLGAGGCGSVFAGYRRADGLPVSVHTHTHTHTHSQTYITVWSGSANQSLVCVLKVAIKYIPKELVLCKHVVSVY